MNLYDKIKSLSPGIEKEDALYFLERASSLFLSSLPELSANKFFIRKEIKTDGLEIGNRYSFITRGKFSCRETRLDLVSLHKESDNQYSADEYDPLYYFKDGKIFVIPEPTETQKAFVSTFPSISIDRNSPETIPNFPNEAEQIVLYYAAFFCNFKLSQDKRSELSSISDNVNTLLQDFYNSIPDPISERVVDTDIEPPDKPDIQNLVSQIDTDIEIPSFDLEFSTEDIPSYNPPSSIEPNVDLSASEEALENAKEFIGSINDAETVPKGAYWLDDEDPEMVSSSVQLAAQEVNRANGYSNNQLQALKAYEQSINNRFSDFKSRISAYNADIDAKITRMKGNIEKFNTELNYIVSKADIKLKQEYQKAKTDLDVYVSELNAFQTVISSKLQEDQLKIQQDIQIFSSNLNRADSYLKSISSLSSKYQMVANSYSSSIREAETMYSMYIQEFKNYIGANNDNGGLIPDSRKRQKSRKN